VLVGILVSVGSLKLAPVAALSNLATRSIRRLDSRLDDCVVNHTEAILHCVRISAVRIGACVRKLAALRQEIVT